MRRSRAMASISRCIFCISACICASLMAGRHHRPDMRCMRIDMRSIRLAICFRCWAVMSSPAISSFICAISSDIVSSASTERGDVGSPRCAARGVDRRAQRSRSAPLLNTLRRSKASQCGAPSRRCSAQACTNRIAIRRHSRSGCSVGSISLSRQITGAPRAADVAGNRDFDASGGLMPRGRRRCRVPSPEPH